jgi:Fe-S-cluster containining protein
MEKGTHGARTHCIRCGECCIASSPTLQLADVSLVKEGGVEKKDLYTIRKGELVRDNVHREMAFAQTEMIKIREREPAGGCVYYDQQGKACRIYEYRPSQCAALTCWDLSGYMEVYNRPKAGRTDLIADGVVRELVAEHERRCSYALVENHVRQIEEMGEPPVQELLELLKFDYHLRPFAADRLGLPLDEMDLVFGRPLIDTIRMFGLQVVREPDGPFLLTVTERQ